ncbi:MAG: DegT/DnrJ/EryC1/StrS family aminotransferase [Acidobacteria bacterium]|nr:MAG: DegT/DnrJ/EryC1/StrS family aminotransferase [Acidobacteriota bacterium]
MTKRPDSGANQDPAPRLAVEGGAPTRSVPLPLEFPGVYRIDEKEIEAAARVLRSRSLFRYYGIEPQKEAESFEAELATFIGTRHALGVGSGTGALHTALAAFEIGPGDEVIVPAYLWVSIAAAVVNLGAIPVLADIDDTFCLDPQAVEQQITGRTRGIVLVHMSGAPGDAEAIRRLAAAHGLFLVEDCAQCFGGSIAGRKVGTWGDIGIFSFQMNKNMTAGEGGGLVTNDQTLYRKAFAAHDLGYARQEGRLVIDDPNLMTWGRGYRLDELRAAVLRVQLRKLPETIGAMRRSKYRIREALQRFDGVKLRRILDPAGDTGCFLITTYRDAETARRVNAALRAEGIVTFPQGISNILMTDWGLHLYYNNASLVRHRGLAFRLSENAGLARDYAKGACPVGDSLFERSILLPIPSCLTQEDEEDIICAFEKVLEALL